MFINFILMLILSIHITTTVSVNSTSISNPDTQNLQNSTSAPLAKIPKIKTNETDTKLLSRGIANTSLVHGANNSETSEVKFANEGSGVFKMNAKDTTSIVIIGANDSAGKVLASTTPAPATIVDNSTKIITPFNDSNSMGNKTIKATLVPKDKTRLVVFKSSTASTTNSTTTTSATTKTTTPKPKKPTITYSSNDILFSAIKPSSMKHIVEGPETPHAQLSQELDGGHYRNHRDYIIPIVSIIFAVPILMGMVIVAYRRFKDFWSTRHYRRMDFLVDGMYND